MDALRFEIRFPLGVYHAQASADFGQPEWPPSPLRLIGALLAAAHEHPGERPEGELAADRAAIERLASAAPPAIHAPRLATQPSGGTDSATAENGDAIAALRGASRWAPRNPGLSELKDGISPRNLGRDRSQVHKVGSAIGDHPVSFAWHDEQLDAPTCARLQALAEEVTFLGTSHSPVVIEVSTSDAEVAVTPRAEWEWRPAPSDDTREGIGVRVPDARTIDAFDRRHAARAGGKPGQPAKAGFVPALRMGREVAYLPPGATDVAAAPVDPRWWGEMLVVEIDTSAGASDLIPKGPSAYLLARSVRSALLSTFGAAGTDGEAPSVLTARGSDPHAAFVSLPFVGARGDGRIMGVAIVLPHAHRLPDVAQQRTAVEDGLRRLVIDGADDPANRRVPIRLPGGAVVRLRPPSPTAERKTLSEATYRRADTHWVTVVPSVSSRWQTGRSPAALLRQVTADCADVGLPAPRSVERLHRPILGGSPAKLISAAQTPEAWRSLLDRPAQHLHVIFDEPVAGPIILGRARHFGLGLMRPTPRSPTAGTSR